MKNYLLVTLATMLPLQELSAQTGNSMKGIYRGTVSNGDEFALIVSKQSDATLCMVGRSSRTAATFSNFAIAADGRFTASNLNVNIVGQIIGATVVTGSIPQRGQTISGLLTSSDSRYGGYYVGFIHSQSGLFGGLCLWVVTSDNRVLLNFNAPSGTDGAIGTMDSEGRLALISAVGSAVTGSFSVPDEGGLSTGSISFPPYGTLTYLAPRKDAPYKLANLSTRGTVGIGANILIVGFVVSTGAKRVLVRAAGPALVPLGVTDTLIDPVLRVLDSSGRIVAENDNWSGAVISQSAAAVGAFAFTVGSRDSALLLSLEPGGYTAQVSGAGNTTGIGLVEVYELR